MVDTTTTNYGFVKPEISGSPDTWGNKLNSNFDIVDAQLKAVDVAKVPIAGGTITGAIKYAADPLAPDDLARKAYVDAMVTGTGPSIQAQIDAALKAYIPIGTIVMWSGSIASIPAGWGLCDGTLQSGVQKPDLRDRFIMGAHSANAPGTVGGASTHNHALGATTLSIAQIPSHIHGVTDPSHVHGLSDPGHTHILGPQPDGFGIDQPDVFQPAYAKSSPVNKNRTQSSPTGITMAYGYTNISIQANGGGGSHTHSLGDGSSYPPYYALAFIMRIL